MKTKENLNDREGQPEITPIGKSDYFIGLQKAFAVTLNYRDTLFMICSEKGVYLGSYKNLQVELSL